MLRRTPTDPQRASALSQHALLTLIRALVVSKVDYCCSVLTGVSGHLLSRLQSVVYAAARLIFYARRSEHVTPLFHDLHWLRVPERIRFRLCVLTFRCLHGSAPSCLANSLRRTVDVAGRQRLRSSDVTTLVVPSTRRSTFGDRAFPVAAPRTWNRLPASVRAATSLSTFHQELKTFLSSALVTMDIIINLFHAPLHISLTINTHFIDYVKCHCSVLA